MIKAVMVMKGLWKDEAGLTSVEYGLLLALFVVAAIAHWVLLGARVQQSVVASTEAFDQATGFGCSP